MMSVSSLNTDTDTDSEWPDTSRDYLAVRWSLEDPTAAKATAERATRYTPDPAPSCVLVGLANSLQSIEFESIEGSVSSRTNDCTLLAQVLTSRGDQIVKERIKPPKEEDMKAALNLILKSLLKENERAEAK